MWKFLLQILSVNENYRIKLIFQQSLHILHDYGAIGSEQVILF